MRDRQRRRLDGRSSRSGSWSASSATTVPHPCVLAYPDGVPAFEWDGSETPVPKVVSGYIRYVETEQLVATAKAARLQVKALRRVGRFVPASTADQGMQASLGAWPADVAAARQAPGPPDTLKPPVARVANHMKPVQTHYKFLHAADIHLDSPLRGLSRYEGVPAEEVRLATRAALTNLVDAAIEE